MGRPNTSYRVLQFIKSRMTEGGDPIYTYLDLTGPLADRNACQKWCRDAKLAAKGTFQIVKFVGGYFTVALETIEKRRIVDAEPEAPAQ